ncbi:hypothetical protein RY27_01315, partial [Litorilinea aerophila]
MHVEADLNLIPHRFPHRVELLDGGQHGLPWLQNGAILGEAPTHKLPAFFLGFQTRFHQRFDLHGVPPVVGIADHLLTHLTTQQFVDGHAQGFAFDVPQRDVDGRDGRAQDPLGGEETAPKEGLPDVLDVGGVLADEQGLEVF